MKIAVAKGDGIGPEIMEAVLKIFDANEVGLEYEFVDMGKWVFDKGFSNGMTPQAQQAIEELGILFKGPMETPKGKGVKSVNVTARKTWNTYANKRTFQTLHGVDTVFSKAGITIARWKAKVWSGFSRWDNALPTDASISTRKSRITSAGWSASIAMIGPISTYLNYRAETFGCCDACSRTCCVWNA